MKILLTSQEASPKGPSSGVQPPDAFRSKPAAPSEKQQKSEANPVILALRRIPETAPESDRQATDKLRIAHEVIQHLGWKKAAAAHCSDGSAVWAFRERCSRERVQRTRAELDAYLDRFGRDDPPHSRRQEIRPPHGSVQRNPILAALDFGAGFSSGR